MNRPPGLFEHPARGPTRRDPGPLGKGVNRMAEERLKGASVRTLPRPNKTYTSGRICAEPGCETKLSMYNKWQYCWQHEPVHEYIPRGKRRSKKAAA
jgi:hypothetical protein